MTDTVVTQAFDAKRQVNDLMRASLEKFSGEIAFFCECAEEGCYQAVWLTTAAYDQARADPAWVALLPGHVGGEP